MYKKQIEYLTNLMVDGARELGVYLTQPQVQQFWAYLDELIKWNKKFNLTRIIEPSQIIIRHFLDALAYFKGFDRVGKIRVIDLGTGAGFPGLPLKVAKPELCLTVVDARWKKIAFVSHICRLLHLEDVVCIQGRAEELAQDSLHNGAYEVVVVRALGKLEAVIKTGFPYLKAGGRLIVSKGPRLWEELSAAERELKYAGGVTADTKRVKLPFSNLIRNIVVVRRVCVSRETLACGEAI